MQEEDMCSLLEGVRVVQPDRVPSVHSNEGGLETREALLHEDVRLLLEETDLVILSLMPFA